MSIFAHKIHKLFTVIFIDIQDLLISSGTIKRGATLYLFGRLKVNINDKGNHLLCWNYCSGQHAWYSVRSVHGTIEWILGNPGWREDITWPGGQFIVSINTGKLQDCSSTKNNMSQIFPKFVCLLPDILSIYSKKLQIL
jgi:hypothetical protein